MRPIKAIVVDSTERTVRQVELPMEPGNTAECYGRQVADGALERLIGSDGFELMYLAPGLVLVMSDEPVPDRETEPLGMWQFDDGEPVPGIGVLCGHDVEQDEWSDCPISFEDACARITFTRRIIRGERMTEFDGGMRVERVTEIVEN